MQNITEIYQENIQKYTIETEKKRNIANLWSWTRVFIFLVFLIVSIIFYTQNFWWVGNILALVGIICFAWSIKKHAKVLEELHFFEHLLAINQNELKVLENDFSMFSTGEKYIDFEHAFANDLDLFGEKSFFQFVNRCVTQKGEQTFADNLKNPTFSKKEILERQEVILELKEKLEFRQSFQAKGMMYQEKNNEFDTFIHWLQLPKTLINKSLVKFLLFFNPIVSLIFLALWSLEIIPFAVVGLWGILNIGIVFSQFNAIKQRTEKIDILKKFIKKYAYLFEILENTNFQKSVFLQNIQTTIQNTQPLKPSQMLKKLSNYADNSDNGVSLFGLIFNALILWNWQVLYRLEKHIQLYEKQISDLFPHLTALDVLNSWANLACNFSDNYCVPEVSEKEFYLEGESIAHPLLPIKDCVGNPVLFDNLGQLAVITGANMAGKSTYLRTITLNLLLAMQGSLVCAKKFTFTPILIYTSMRTKDSLASRESFFYAEIKRLKLLLDRLNQQEKIFVVLDEILKGTNSADQHAGAKALLTQLAHKKAVGLIATHDLRLGEWAKNYPQHFKNQCFEIHIQNNHLHFTYQLKEGINQNLNATFLLTKMGIVEVEM